MIPRDTMVSARFPKDVKDAIGEMAKQFDMSMSDIIVRFCRDGLNRIGYQKKPETKKMLESGNFIDV